MLKAFITEVITTVPLGMCLQRSTGLSTSMGRL